MIANEILDQSENDSSDFNLNKAIASTSIWAKAFAIILIIEKLFELYYSYAAIKLYNIDISSFATLWNEFSHSILNSLFTFPVVYFLWKFSTTANSYKTNQIESGKDTSALYYYLMLFFFMLALKRVLILVY